MIGEVMFNVELNTFFKDFRGLKRNDMNRYFFVYVAGRNSGTEQKKNSYVQNERIGK